MKDHNEMTVQECMDEVHIDMCPGGYRYDDFSKTAYYKTKVSEDWSRDHPLSPTLDSAHAAMPEGWRWSREHGEWIGFPPKGSLRRLVRTNDTGNPQQDFWRLVVACRRAGKEGGR